MLSAWVELTDWLTKLALFCLSFSHSPLYVTYDSLDALEAAEEAYKVQLQKVIEAPATVIGVGHRQQAQRGNLRSAGDDTIMGDDDSTVAATPSNQTQERFWNRRSASPGY